MTENQLIQLGFKKKKLDDEYWYELKHKRHTFITNDTLRNNRKDKWFIGYADKWNVDGFWFNEKLSDINDFKNVFKILTGSEL